MTSATAECHPRDAQIPPIDIDAQLRVVSVPRSDGDDGIYADRAGRSAPRPADPDLRERRGLEIRQGHRGQIEEPDVMKARPVLRDHISMSGVDLLPPDVRRVGSSWLPPLEIERCGSLYGGSPATQYWTLHRNRAGDRGGDGAR